MKHCFERAHGVFSKLHWPCLPVNTDDDLGSGNKQDWNSQNRLRFPARATSELAKWTANSTRYRAWPTGLQFIGSTNNQLLLCSCTLHMSLITGSTNWKLLLLQRDS